ncbi:hypothetical protein PENTCL1PPCAC_30678, partial [Pristionchus entomophagus]
KGGRFATMEESRSPVSVDSTSRGDSDVETALSFNLSLISSDCDAMGSKRSKRSRREKRNSQRTTDASEIAMKLEQCETPDVIDEAAATVVDADTVIDGVVLVDAEPAPLTPTRASSIPVLCRWSTIMRSARSYTTIRPVSEDLLPTGAKPSRIPRWAAASVAVTPPDQTAFSFDDDYQQQHHTMSSASSLSSVEDHSCYVTEAAAVFASFENKKHGIELDIGIELAATAPGGCLILASITVPE